MSDGTVMVNRAPVLTLWAAVVAERMGYDRDAALTLGKAVSGLNAQTKGRMLGIFGEPKAPERGGPPKKTGLGEDGWVEICRRPVPIMHTECGIRAVVKDKPISPESVEKYLAGKFGEALPTVREALCELASAFKPDDLAEVSYELYEEFRPKIEAGQRGWGQPGELSLSLIRSLAKRKGR